MQAQGRHITFIYSEESKDLREPLAQHDPNAVVHAVPVDEFLQDPEPAIRQANHIVVSAPMAALKAVIRIAIDHELGVGILPLKSQRSLARYFRLPDGPDEQIELALQPEGQTRDVIFCNGELVLFKATIGRMPVLDGTDQSGRWKALRNIMSRFRGIRLLGFEFDTANGKHIETAASGCMIVQHHAGSLASRLIANDGSSTDGMISMVVGAPLSLLAYLKFLYQVLVGVHSRDKVPSTIGYIKSAGLTVSSEVPLKVDIDGEEVTRTPAKFAVVPRALRVNTGPVPDQEAARVNDTNERLNIGNLPIGSEVTKARKKAIPFFPYASEERFKDLFVALRDDASTGSTYVVLMILSTVLATIGLFQNSTSVVIGAMLLAPLMAPIVSFAMGLLRRHNELTRDSAIKIVIGIALALGSAALLTLMLPHKLVTDEMLARTSPSLLDLGVAIFAGIAGAYTKAYKEILQSLAGVAIAVALVPPLAVAGVGLGRGDPYFFGQAFLLFSTNLVGIIVAATLTFRVLGYSAAIRGKRSLVYVILTLVVISIPLYLTYEDIVDKLHLERGWQNERFLVNGKYLIIKNATIIHRRDRDGVIMDILARERLTRGDLNDFKEKIQTHFSKKLVIHANITYRL